MSDQVPCDDFEDDPVLAELRRIRDAQSAVYGYDSERRLADAQRMQFLFGNDVVGLGPSGELEVIFKGSGNIDFEVGRIIPSTEMTRVSSDG